MDGGRFLSVTRPYQPSRCPVRSPVRSSSPARTELV
jgi:hypothetical protein